MHFSTFAKFGVFSSIEHWKRRSHAHAKLVLAIFLICENSSIFFIDFWKSAWRLHHTHIFRVGDFQKVPKCPSRNSEEWQEFTCLAPPGLPRPVQQQNGSKFIQNPSKSVFKIQQNGAIIIQAATGRRWPNEHKFVQMATINKVQNELIVIRAATGRWPNWIPRLATGIITGLIILENAMSLMGTRHGTRDELLYQVA